MCTKNISQKVLREQYKKMGLLKHYLNLYDYQNKKAIEEEFNSDSLLNTPRHLQIIKMAEFIVAYENIKDRKH